ncbi:MULTISPECIES: mandelate racemase/muconate lactonizing enzyme family protein [unclassified Aureimonas]|uniref:mandelate racemase/muconate lactonizing enzyme family protein n=1 Tax=unclassified Aureimonas TaxID=2615206 RepID=UPI0006FA4374|nr:MULTISPECIES: enolase C-terminal domain-like protein [unclassified Aureimonas]KQT62927.1 L-alanine-DL-glutamate epimerase [Aureimonas sp. Leaf427]KQT74836.1 L-alanine-DL-glutamate epimerase [Aureimonas sp. Leaf460]
MEDTIRIEAIDIASCRLLLEKPVRLGSVTVESRDYVCVRVRTDAGITGHAIGYRSGSQLFDSLEALAPHLLGRDPLMRQETADYLETSFVPSRASHLRAMSLFDVALWDITAKRAGLPLYVMLGGMRRSVPALPVLGFSYNDRPIQEILDEVARHRDAGETIAKVMIKGSDVVANGRYVQTLASTYRDDLSLAVDTHWSWRTLTEALDTCRRIDDCGLAFIEDPFLPQQWRLSGELGSKLRTPLAAGEDVLDPYSYLDLCSGVDILRVDATSCGGIATAMNAIAIAAARGRRVLPHVFPYLHLHLACAQNTIMAVEYIPEHTGTDPVRRLLKDFPVIKDGHFMVSDEPGAGCDLEWSNVCDHAVRSSSVESPT